MHYLIAFILSGTISLIAFQMRALSLSGAIAACVSGGVIFGFGGLPWAVLLLTFFISSSLLSKLVSRSDRRLSRKYSKGSRRDWAQVFANDGLGMILAIFNYCYPGQTWLFVAFAGSMASVNADTWATEIGALSPSPPRLIHNGKQVEAGTSGGVSLVGSLGGFCGAALIGLVSIPFALSRGLDVFVFVGIVVVGGLFGMVIDSLLGATLQAGYFCPHCEEKTEQHPIHTCGEKTYKIRGWRLMNNDLVNLLSAFVSAGLTTLLFRVLL